MARRRARGEGSIRRLEGRDLWQGRFTTPSGKRRSVYAKTRAEVARKMARGSREAEKGLAPQDEKITVGRYLEVWLDSIRPPAVKTRTWESYESHCRVHLIPRLGDHRLAFLTAGDVTKLANAMLQNGLSPATAERVRATLRNALNDAIRENLIRQNPVSMAKPLKVPKYRGVALTAEQANHLLDSTVGDRYHALWAVALGTGLRLGECLGLRWQDLDLGATRLTVRHTLQPKRPTTDSWRLAEPKSEESRREIILANWVVEALLAQKAAQGRVRLRAGDKWADHDFVFTNRTGGPLGGSEVARALKTTLAEAGLPRCRFHDLRHSAASLILLQGASLKTAQTIMGHSTIGVTGNLYAHVYDVARKDAAAKADAWREAK